MKGLPFHDIWAMFLADQKREKDIRDALDAAFTEDLTKIYTSSYKNEASKDINHGLRRHSQPKKTGDTCKL